jgi:hypothetical protein
MVSKGEVGGGAVGEVQDFADAVINNVEKVLENVHPSSWC